MTNLEIILLIYSIILTYTVGAIITGVIVQDWRISNSIFEVMMLFWVLMPIWYLMFRYNQSKNEQFISNFKSEVKLEYYKKYPYDTSNYN